MKFDDLIEKANKEYAHTEVELPDDKGTVVLRNVLQLSDEEREQISKVTKASKDVDADEAEESESLFDQLAGALRIAAADKGLVEVLIDLLDRNNAYILTLFREYVKSTQVGEA